MSVSEVARQKRNHHQDAIGHDHREIDENDPNHVIAIDDVMSMIEGGMIVDARGDAHGKL